MGRMLAPAFLAARGSAPSARTGNGRGREGVKWYQFRYRTNSRHVRGSAFLFRSRQFGRDRYTDWNPVPMNLLQTGGTVGSPFAGVPLGVVAVGGLVALVAGALLRVVALRSDRRGPTDPNIQTSGRLAVLVTVAWIGLSYASLVVLGRFTVELFIIVAVIGFLVSEFLLSPPQTSDRWWSRFRLLRIPVLLVFAYVVFQRVMTVVQ